MDRPAARVLLLDADDRILLFRFYAPEVDQAWWLTPGGGLEPEESPEQGALRELAEETGLAGIELGACVWVREHVFPWQGQVLRQLERFYVARTAAFEPEPIRSDHSELFQLQGHRWWSLEELEAATDQVFAPRRLPALLRGLLGEGWPAEPIDVGV